MTQHPFRKLLPVILIFTVLTFSSCKEKTVEKARSQPQEEAQSKPIIVGANNTQAYFPLLKDKKIALVGNNTSVLFDSSGARVSQHLLDTLMGRGLTVTKIFAPEHGLRGNVDAGEIIGHEVDEKTGIPILSLYADNNNNTSENFKPSPEQLKEVDVILFDIQDVGTRFYTYLSTLHYIMEAASEQQIPVIVLDRPNPNGHYVDGPVLELEFKSFVGLHPVPIVYGMTIGEYAQMINGEKWLKNGVKCDLTVIPLQNYSHSSTYSLPLRPSPNLPNDRSINLYPSLCLFEGTTISCGRGTEKQFQIFGSPDLPSDTYNYTFTPQPNFGSKDPKHNGKICHGLDLSQTETLNSLNFQWLIDAYQASPQKENFFRDRHFTLLAGTDQLKNQIVKGLSFEQIKDSWKEGLDAFKITREKYLLYE